ncbi:MAG: hypothetical protein KAS22_11400, partial [Candidatus Heimdallarchaeota archaeon]|nr:hypothetical protein [Candidatus Heimdallarchaeota archaeon]
IERTLKSLISIGKDYSEKSLLKLADDAYQKKNQWKKDAGQIFSVDKLADRLFKFKTPHGFLKKEFIREAIEYYSKLSSIPLNSE